MTSNFAIGHNFEDFIIPLADNAGVHALESVSLFSYQHSFDNLWQRLLKYKGYEFKSNEKILFLHMDTDFIIDEIPFMLYNLQLILHNLTIPNFSCVIVSQQDIQHQLTKVNSLITNDPSPINNIECQWYFNIHNAKNALFNNNIERSFTFLSNHVRIHRIAMFNWLTQEGLLEKGLISFSNLSNSITATNDMHYAESYAESYTCPLTFITNSTNTRINENWICTDDALLHLFFDSNKKFKNFEEAPTDINAANTELIAKGFCYVSNESTFNYPVFLTEKSFKGFAAYRPTIFFGPCGSLHKLKSLGFKTWSNWWDESYDSIQDPTERFKAVCNLIKYVSSLSLTDCSDILNDMRDILEYNYKQYMQFNSIVTSSTHRQFLTLLKK